MRIILFIFVVISFPSRAVPDVNIVLHLGLSAVESSDFIFTRNQMQRSSVEKDKITDAHFEYSGWCCYWLPPGYKQCCFHTDKQTRVNTLN